MNTRQIYSGHTGVLVTNGLTISTKDGETASKALFDAAHKAAKKTRRKGNSSPVKEAFLELIRVQGANALIQEHSLHKSEDEKIHAFEISIAEETAEIELLQEQLENKLQEVTGIREADETVETAEKLAESRKALDEVSQTLARKKEALKGHQDNHKGLANRQKVRQDNAKRAFRKIAA